MMNKLLISLFLSSVITLGGCGLTKENYYVKHVEFPQDATLEQKIDMAARLVPTPQQAAWQQMELTAFLHFGINTFTGREWGDGKEDPRIPRTERRLPDDRADHGGRWDRREEI